MFGGLFSDLGNKVVFTKDLIKVMTNPRNALFRKELVSLYKEERPFVEEYVNIISSNPNFSKELGLLLKERSDVVISLLGVLSKELNINKDKLNDIDVSQYKIENFNTLLDTYINNEDKGVKDFLNIEDAQKIGVNGVSENSVEEFKHNHENLLRELDGILINNLDFVKLLKGVISDNNGFIKKMLYLIVHKPVLVSEISRVAKENPKLIENFGGLLNNNPMVITDLMKVFK